MSQYFKRSYSFSQGPFTQLTGPSKSPSKGDGPFDGKIGSGPYSVRQCKFNGDGDGDGMCKRIIMVFHTKRL